MLDWVAVAREWKPGEYVAKPAALVALLCYAATGHHHSPWLIVALACSVLGDVYLMLPGDLFLLGLAAFLGAHVAYALAIGGPMGERAAWFAAVLVLSGPVALPILRAVRARPMQAAVGVYMLTIAVMVASAVASGSLVCAGGAVLFMVSDSLIGWNRFVRPFAHSQLAIMTTYHLGQLALVTALR